MAVIFPIVTEAQRAMLAVAIVSSTLAVIAVCLRLLAHHIARKKWNMSDYLLIMACIFAVGLECISVTFVVQTGVGYDHEDAIVAEHGRQPITKLYKLIMPVQTLWVLSLSCTKFSILLLYLRIFPAKAVVRIVWGTSAVVAAWAIGTILATFLVCRPMAYNWNPNISGGTCGREIVSYIVSGTINLFTDLAVVIIPMPLLCQLQMARSRKMTLMAVLGLGFVACIVSLLRIHTLFGVRFGDITFTLPHANIFTGLEPCLAIILSSIPLMRPLIDRPPKSPRATVGQAADFPVLSRRGPAAATNRLDSQTDDSHPLWLRPMGHNAYAGVAALHPYGRDDLSIRSEESLSKKHARQKSLGQNPAGGISVTQEFEVIEE
ncbi:hypothetical protein BDW42DRAFT_199069 [Aspergillus taichungensis]|uniref:Rhodopsin domain-containing protein n=1 Tax=Aspergillus taichungensis TaxID=482145 RepID=A0A2J5HGT4_9EURO|nr:hypothetical protein BDW42DRAFT_199069 [Aspergillus taichungensis]